MSDRQLDEFLFARWTFTLDMDSDLRGVEHCAPESDAPRH